MEAEATDAAKGADGFSIELCADRLRGVFNYFEFMFLRKGQQFFHWRGLACEMNRNNRASFGSDRALDGLRVYVEIFADVGKFRRRTSQGNATGTGEIGIWRGDDFIAGPHAKNLQRED